jgi:hypothetical protein
MPTYPSNPHMPVCASFKKTGKCVTMDQTDKICTFDHPDSQSAERSLGVGVPPTSPSTPSKGSPARNSSQEDAELDAKLARMASVSSGGSPSPTAPARSPSKVAIESSPRSPSAGRAKTTVKEETSTHTVRCLLISMAGIPDRELEIVDGGVGGSV